METTTTTLDQLVSEALHTTTTTIDQQVSEVLHNMNNALERIGKDISATQIIDVTTLLPIPAIDVVTPSHLLNSNQNIREVSNSPLAFPIGDVATPAFSSTSTFETNTVYETLLETASSLHSSFSRNPPSETASNSRSPQPNKRQYTNRERFELDCKIRNWRSEQSKSFPSSFLLPPLSKSERERKTRSAPVSPARHPREVTVPPSASVLSTDIDLPRPFFYLSSTLENSTFSNELANDRVSDATRKILDFLANKVDQLAVSINTIQYNLTKIAESVQGLQETDSKNSDQVNHSDINIVNLRNVDDIEEWMGREGNVYIGRANDKCEASKWANRHKLKDHNYDREKVVELFRADIMSNDELLKSIPELRGKVLGCWCSPGLCHAEVLHELAGNSPKYEPTPEHTFDQKLDHLENKFDTYTKILKKENKSMKEENAQLREKLENYIAEETDREDRIKDCLNNPVNVPIPCAIGLKHDLEQKLAEFDVRLANCERRPDGDGPALPQPPRTRLRSFSEECRNIPQEVDDEHPCFDQFTQFVNQWDSKIKDMDIRLLECEQYSRRECVVISGIPGNIRDVKLETTVINILSKLDIPIKSEDISAIHRLGVSNDTRYPARVIVKFVNRKITNLCFERKDWLPDLRNTLKMNIRFYESLAQLNQESLKLCTWLFNTGKIYDHFMRNGYCKIIINEKDKPVKVPHPQFLRDQFDIPEGFPSRF